MSARPTIAARRDAELARLERAAHRRPLSPHELDRLAHLTFLADARGYRVRHDRSRVEAMRRGRAS